VPDLERILQNTPGSVSKQWYEAGVAVDPGTVNVNVTRADGTVLVTGGSVSGTGTGARTYALTTATHTPLLDTLTLTWVSSDKGTLVSYVEVVGGFLFSLAELSAEVANSTTSYTAAEMAEARTYAEVRLERACGVAFVPRYELETVPGSGTTGLLLKWPYVRAIRSASATYNGTTTTLSASDLLALTWTGAGGLYGYTWTLGYPWVIGYEHGESVPDPGASEAALVLAKHKLVKGPIDERATQRQSEFGPINLATPGMFGSQFGIPVVDAFVKDRNMNVGVA
jgi:hypothetical protein